MLCLFDSTEIHFVIVHLSFVSYSYVTAYNVLFLKQ